MKKITFGLALLASFYAACAFGDARSFETSVASLVAQSQGARKSCAAYRAELTRLDRTPNPVFRNRTAALSVMKGLARYPAIPAQSAKAYEMAMGKLPAGINWTWFMRSYGSLAGSCAIMQSYTGMNRLINTTRVVRFTAAERAQIRGTALSFISKNVKQPGTLTVALIQASLLENLVDSRLARLDSKSARDLKTLMKQGDAVRGQLADRVRSRKNATDQQRAADYVYELKSANSLRLRFLSILSKVR